MLLIRIVNLVIGLPEDVAAVAAKQGLLEFITLPTEPGVNFGPAVNANAHIEMNEMFDFMTMAAWICFLGAAQVARMVTYLACPRID